MISWINKQVGQIDNEVAKAFHGLLEFFGIYHKDPKWGFDGAPLHDPCTIAWLIDETLFETKRMNVNIISSIIPLQCKELR